MYAPLPATLGQGDDMPLEPLPLRRERSSLANTTVLHPTTLSGPSADLTHMRRSSRDSRPQASSPLLNLASAPDNPPRNYSEDSKLSEKSRETPLTLRQGSTQAEVPSRAHSREPFASGNSNPSLRLEPDDGQHRGLPPHKFVSEKQFWKLFGGGLKRFGYTFALAAVFVYTIHRFSNDKVLSRDKKLLFNAISTGLSMVLGMSVDHGFKSMAIDIRWWLLSRKKRSLSDVCLSNPTLHWF
jgi:hypothetical protein